MTTYLSSSQVLVGNNPDILPELVEADFESSAPAAIRQTLSSTGNGTDFEYKVISGSFMSNDTRNDPSCLFITGYRSGPSDGAEKERFFNGYGIAIMPLSGQAQADGRHNVFVVDNSIAVNQVVLEEVVHTGWGDLSYLASTSVTIDPDVEYSFELHFGEGGVLDFYIAEKGAALVNEISYGAYQHQATGTYWGVSASYTDGYKWSIDNLALSFKDARHPISYFELDGAMFTDDFSVVVSAFAYGWDDPNPIAYGIKMYAYNYTNDEWDEVDSHSLGVGNNIMLRTSNLSQTDYISSSDDYIRILLVGDYPSSFDNAAEGYLHVDEIYAENWNQEFVNVGGMGDVYLHEAALPNEYQIEMYSVDAFEWLRASNEKIDGDFHLPMAWITKVEQLDGLGNVIGILELAADYTIDIYDEYKRFSADEQNKIIFDTPGINVRITYLTFDNVEAVQDYIDNDYRRNTCDDLLAFVCEPWELYITLEYHGSANRSDLRDALSQWVMNTVRYTFEDYEINVLLQALSNVTDVNVEELRVIKHSRSGDQEEEIADSLTLDEYGYQQFIMFNDIVHIIFTTDSD